ncbi:MAG TPA: hypothetical protein VEV41_01275 [Terriglobales bacterium]|nr:hypothetical protein [Terriglobales bacterium]
MLSDRAETPHAHNWNLMLAEHGVIIYLWHLDSPDLSYKLAGDYCQHYDSRYGKGLSDPSRTKIEEIIRCDSFSPLKRWKKNRNESAVHIATRPVSRLHPPLHYVTRAPAG